MRCTSHNAALLPRAPVCQFLFKRGCTLDTNSRADHPGVLDRPSTSIRRRLARAPVSSTPGNFFSGPSVLTDVLTDPFLMLSEFNPAQHLLWGVETNPHPDSYLESAPLLVEPIPKQPKHFLSPPPNPLFLMN